MSHSAERGHYFEKKVAELLEKQECIVTAMNYRSKYGEIDIVAETKNYLLFIEVKMRKENSVVSPAQAVDKNKQRRIILTALDYIRRAHTDLQPRFDVAQVVERTENGKKRYGVYYIKNAFDAELLNEFGGF